VEYWPELAWEPPAVAAVTAAGQRADSEGYCFCPGFRNLQQKSWKEQWSKVLGKVDLTLKWDQWMRMVPCQESFGTALEC
jgi:hypothetical protein